MAHQLVPFAFVLAVRDLERSAAWYRDVLGFAIDWPQGSDWRLAVRGNVRLMLGHCPADRPAAELGSHSWFGYLQTDDVEGLRAQIVARGADCSPLRDTAYGMREITVTTPDGHRIVFGQEMKKPGA